MAVALIELVAEVLWFRLVLVLKPVPEAFWKDFLSPPFNNFDGDNLLFATCTLCLYLLGFFNLGTLSSKTESFKIDSYSVCMLSLTSAPSFGVALLSYSLRTDFVGLFQPRFICNLTGEGICLIPGPLFKNDLEVGKDDLSGSFFGLELCLVIWFISWMTWF